MSSTMTEILGTPLHMLHNEIDRCKNLLTGPDRCRGCQQLSYLNRVVTVCCERMPDDFRNEVSLNFEDERTLVPRSAISTVQSVSLYAKILHLDLQVRLFTAKIANTISSDTNQTSQLGADNRSGNNQVWSN